MSDDHFGTREEMIDRYRQLERELAEAKARADHAAREYVEERKEHQETERENAALRELLAEWRATELDTEDDEYQPWMNQFTARVDALLDPRPAGCTGSE